MIDGLWFLKLALNHIPKRLRLSRNIKYYNFINT